MPIKKTVIRVYDSYGNDYQVPYDDWPKHWDGIKRYLGASLFNDSLTVSVTGGEEDGGYSIREQGEPFIISQQWTLMEIEELTPEEKEAEFLEDLQGHPYWGEHN